MSAKNYPQFVILTVEPLNNQNQNFRLGLNTLDFNQIQPSAIGIKSVEVFFGDNLFIIIAALLTYQNYGKLVNPDISNWIIVNHLHEYEIGRPTKLIFELTVTSKKHTYKLYKNQFLKS